ncbi:uncharacterized protein LOC107265220 isoform X1 [Cephus cinctus]|uniref:Uncharacterized protein LOC107265220 isoform X1 n=1 Tax=Cephus cinctus TaxID=211228 RepID=A0AAJ7BNL1_CEPCN|nr:uncharacterized protein LOC107265220 isoform X1 [Cephus cinctus]
MLRDVSLILLLDVEAVCTTLAYWITAPSRMRFESSKIKGVLLGDSGYPCKSYLLTQFLRPRTPAEERYNASHVRTRNVVERCFGEWKGMFRALRNSMQISLPTARTAIVEMAVLYNIRHEFGDTNLYGIIFPIQKTMRGRSNGRKRMSAQLRKNHLHWLLAVSSVSSSCSSTSREARL